MTQTRNLIDENGRRTDGRTADELREIKITVGVVKNADGSAFIEFGKNKIVAAVYGPREVHTKHMALPDRCVLRCRYHMSPFSTDTRKNTAPSRREIEISKEMREALEPALMLEDYPRAAIDVFVEVLQADGGSRCAGITAASIALADAGINMRDIVASCAAGKVDEKIVLDINDTEDKEGEADMPVAFKARVWSHALTVLLDEEIDDGFAEDFFRVQHVKRNPKLVGDATRIRHLIVGAAAIGCAARDGLF